MGIVHTDIDWGGAHACTVYFVRNGTVFGRKGAKGPEVSCGEVSLPANIKGLAVCKRNPTTNKIDIEFKESRAASPPKRAATPPRAPRATTPPPRPRTKRPLFVDEED
jgi:hypothetical protein